MLPPTDQPRRSNTGHPRRWTILAFVLVAECMDLLDGTIVNVAAPTIHRDLHAAPPRSSGSSAATRSPSPSALIAGARLGDISVASACS